MAELEKALKRIAGFCRRSNGDAQVFQEMVQAFRDTGIAGVERVMIEHNRRRRQVSDSEKARIRCLALAHPTWGQVRLAAALAEEGVSLSAAVVHRILGELHLGGFYQRGQALEEAYREGTLILSPEQSAFLGTVNPCFRDRHLMPDSPEAVPGTVMDVESFFLGCLPGSSTKIYVHAAVDVLSSYAFAFLHTTTAPQVAVSLLHHQVIPFLHERACSVRMVHSKKGRVFLGGVHHLYQTYLKLSQIDYRHTGNSTCGGFVDRFRVAVRDEFFKELPWSDVIPTDRTGGSPTSLVSHSLSSQPVLSQPVSPESSLFALPVFEPLPASRSGKETPESPAVAVSSGGSSGVGDPSSENRPPDGSPLRSISALQRAFTDWLHSYNHQRPMFGYPNDGATPAERLQSFLDGVACGEGTPNGDLSCDEDSPQAETVP